MSRYYPSVYPGAWPIVAERKVMREVAPGVMDELWSVGWRHFGPEFFRTSLMMDEEGLKRQIALRARVGEFEASKSQRRTMRRNRDLEVEVAPARPGAEEARLFDLHKGRFRRNVPERLEDFLGEGEAGRPCRCVQVSVRQAGRLIAASFLDLGERSCSSVYGVFDPAHGGRRLGIFTMLVELEWARERGFRYYYTGYATVESSCYDYKMRFSALEYYDWMGTWKTVEELPVR